MDAVLQSLFSGFPYYLLHSATTLVMLAVGVGIYLLITPYKEVRLVRAGNTAAAISLAGAVVGLALPLAFSLAASINVFDIVIWGGVALIMQLLAFAIVWLVLRDLPRRITDGEVAAAVVLAAISLAVAMVNAAAVAG
jgi:putative membrane protein